MKDKLAEKRFRKDFNRQQIKVAERRGAMKRAYGRRQAKSPLFRDPISGQVTFDKVIERLMPDTVGGLLKCSGSVFFHDFIKLRPEIGIRGHVRLEVPEIFSVIDKPEDAYDFLAKSLAVVLYGKNSDVRFDYSKCNRVDVGAQVLLDLILIDVIDFFNRCLETHLIHSKFKWVRKAIGAKGLQSTKVSIQQLLRSIGSLAIFGEEKAFSNIVPCSLTRFRRDPSWTGEAAAERKEVETTRLLEYVVKSLAKVNKTLTGEKLDSLGIVIGEALANAEEHSSTHRRISIGYFRLDDTDPDRIGTFRLVILNFGTTIYEKFADPDCPNPRIVAQMRSLSSRYTKSGFFSPGKFSEEELWTLYALQEGVTSIDPVERRRGKGTIRYIENFFAIKGSDELDPISRMTVLSGNTRITFDGKYRTAGKGPTGDEVRVMTFNKSGTLEKPPDGNYVEATQSYFPGVLISARILLQRDDTQNG